MNLTIKEMLDLPSLKGLKVIAGREGLERFVTTITFGEVPAYEYLKGGEFVISSGYLYKDNTMEIIDVIHKLKESGASALGIKVGRFINEIPDEVIKLADSLKIPIITVPIELAYADVINPVQSEIINKQAKRLEFSEKILKLFTNNIIRGGTIHNVIDDLSSTLQKNIIYYDKYFDNEIIGKVDDNLEMNFNNSTLNEMISTKISIPVEIESRKYGYIILSDDNKQAYNLTDYEEIAIEHASSVIKLQIQKKISNQQIESKYRNEFVQDLITDNLNSLEELNRRAEFYGWHFDKGMIAVIVDIDEYKSRYMKFDDNNPTEAIINTKEDIFRDTRKHFKKHFQNIIYATFSDYIVILLDRGNKDLSSFLNELKDVSDKLRKKIYKSYSFTLTIGIGKYMECVKDVHHSYSQAKKSIKLGRLIYGNDNTVHYEKLGIFNLLLSVYQSPEAQEFYLENLGKLIDYDREHSADLLETIKVLSKNDWNLKTSAEELFIHYNTMKYRFKRISEILNIDLSNSEQKLNIALSLKLTQMKE
ncbi:PucR family transcriptional regulator [Oceanirhabdus seepicola]|uniref:PucR family transcriptional regulator ligand-binding domain-containing protein n=1 Tax=Oceanirhabdus seepicola TaxID=2828781 RepID=A0A9J6NY30_9CLOT|nr:PucR family transcriptional regulator [Oceanirhabdus seepicola]MCM1989423.1 PucR family transcriptional regulator ligand-binding domain-containing protein [Oceanirhabdus seepicola]